MVCDWIDEGETPCAACRAQRAHNQAHGAHNNKKQQATPAGARARKGERSQALRGQRASHGHGRGVLWAAVASAAVAVLSLDVVEVEADLRPQVLGERLHGDVWVGVRDGGPCLLRRAQRTEGREQGCRQRGRRRTLSSSTASLPPAWRSVCGGTQVTQRSPVSRKPEFLRIETCGEPLGSLSSHTTHLPMPSACSTLKSSRVGNLEIVSVGGPLHGQRANVSGIAGHNGGECPERSLGSVKDMGQLATDWVERWGEKRGSGPASGSLVLMGERMALVSNMPGIVPASRGEDRRRRTGQGARQRARRRRRGRCSSR